MVGQGVTPTGGPEASHGSAVWEEPFLEADCVQ